MIFFNFFQCCISNDFVETLWDQKNIKFLCKKLGNNLSISKFYFPITILEWANIIYI